MSRVIKIFLLLISLSGCALKPPIHEQDFFIPTAVNVPKGYCVLYLYRGQDVWTAQKITTITINQHISVKLGDSTYTEFILLPKQYQLRSDPWGFTKQVTLKEGNVYYVKFYLETALSSDQLSQMSYKMENGRYLIGDYLFQDRDVAVMELAGCRRVKPEVISYIS